MSTKASIIYRQRPYVHFFFDYDDEKFYLHVDEKEWEVPVKEAEEISQSIRTSLHTVYMTDVVVPKGDSFENRS